MTLFLKTKNAKIVIAMQVTVDAYGPEEEAGGWWVYLDMGLAFPFQARCRAERRISPLRIGETVRVLGMADEDDCRSEMFVMIEWQGRQLGVPLAQLDPMGVDDDTAEAVADWHYWVGRGYGWL